MSIKLLDLADMLPKMTAEYGSVYAAGSIAAGTYPTIDAETDVIFVWNMLVANASMPEDQAYAITKAIFDNKAALAAASPSANGLAIEAQTSSNSPIAFHPGTLRFLAENGIVP